MEGVLSMAQGNGYDDREGGRPASVLSSITLNRKHYVYSNKPIYRVYSSRSDFKLVEADSASEAFEKSGVVRPVKIEREHFYRTLALQANDMQASDESVEINVELPDMNGKTGLVFAALDDETLNDKPDFEELSLSDMKAKGTVQPEVAEEEPAIEDAMPPPVAAQPDPRPEDEIIPPSEPLSEAEEEAAELSAEEVEALLGGEG